MIRTVHVLPGCHAWMLCVDVVRRRQVSYSTVQFSSAVAIQEQITLNNSSLLVPHPIYTIVIHELCKFI